MKKGKGMKKMRKVIREYKEGELRSGSKKGPLVTNPQATVCFSVDHHFSVGEKVSFRVSSAYGMDEINNMTGTVLSIGNMAEGAVYTAVAAGQAANAIRVDINSSGFTAFSMPTSALFAAGETPAMVVPAGAGPESGANPP